MEGMEEGKRTTVVVVQNKQATADKLVREQKCVFRGFIREVPSEQVLRALKDSQGFTPIFQRYAHEEEAAQQQRGTVRDTEEEGQSSQSSPTGAGTGEGGEVRVVREEGEVVREGREPSPANDCKRLRRSLSSAEEPPFLRAISAAVEEMMTQLFPRNAFRRSRAALVLCRAGCAEQDFHYDYSPLCPFSRSSFACVVFLESESQFSLQNGRTTVRLDFDAGDVLVFRGTQLHAGAAYPHNDKLYAYYHFDDPRSTRCEDAIYGKHDFAEPLREARLTHITKAHSNHMRDRRIQKAEKAAKMHKYMEKYMEMRKKTKTI